MESTELQEGLFKAIQTIAKSEVNKMSFDKTLVCTIKDNTNATRGEYYVTDESSSFFAYSEVTTYQKGEMVLVKVPNGDFNNQKHIEGRYISGQGEDYNYVSPYTQFVSYTTNLIENPDTVGQLLTNFQGNVFTDVTEANINTEPKHSIAKTFWKAPRITEVEGYDYNIMYLAADFKSLIGTDNQENIQLKSGYYGIKLIMDMTYLDMNGNEVTNEGIDFYLTNEDMNGNAYDFETYYKQEKIFILDDKYVRNGLKISNVRVLFFQGNNDDTIVFENLQNEWVHWYTEVENEKVLLTPNLFATNINLQFGYKEEKTNIDKIVLDVRKINGGYGSDGQNPNALNYYSYLPESEKKRLKEEGNPDWYIEENYDKLLKEYNKKILYINKQKSFIDLLKIRDEEQINLKIDLYQYVDPKYGRESESNNADAGENWEFKHSYTKMDAVNYGFDPDITHEVEKFKVIAYYESPVGSDEVVDPVTGEVLVPDTKHKKLVGDELVFTLIGEVQKPENEYLVIDCDNDGIFKIYDLKGRLINNFEKYTKRHLYAHKENNSDATLRSITWRIPYKNTMIVPISYEEFMEGYSQRERGYEKNEEEGVIYYTIYNPKEGDFYFRIKDYLSSKDINNTIYCTAKFNNGASYEVIAKTLEFCTIDYFGTEYKVDACFENGSAAIPVGKEQWVQIRVLSAENEDITQQIIDQGLQFGLEWYSKPEESLMTVSEVDQTRFRFLLNAEEDTIFGKRITETGYRIRQTEEDDNQIRIIEDTIGDQGDLNYTETRVTELMQDSQSGAWEQKTRITDDERIRRTEINYSMVPDLTKYFGSHILRIDIQGFESRDDNDPSDNTESREKITIIGYFPIPVTSSASYTQYIGPTQILYDSTGANPAYYKGEPKLYYTDSENIEHQNSDITWELQNTDSSTATFEDYELTIPRRILKVPPIIVEGRKCINMLARSKKDNSVLWIQPIFISQDLWDDKVLNSWQDFSIRSIVSGLTQMESDGSLSGVFMGKIVDEDALERLEIQKATLLESIQDIRNQINTDYAYLDYLYTKPRTEEIDAEIDYYIEEVIPADEEQEERLHEQLEEINLKIEKSESVTGLYAVNKSEIFFKLTEGGDFSLGDNDEILITSTETKIRSKDKTSILLDLENNDFKFIHNNLIIDPKNEDGVVIETPGLKLHKDGLIESEKDRIIFNGTEYKERIIPATNGKMYKVLAAAVTEDVLLLNTGGLLELSEDDDYLELVQ